MKTSDTNMTLKNALHCFFLLNLLYTKVFKMIILIGGYVLIHEARQTLFI